MNKEDQVSRDHQKILVFAAILIVVLLIIISIYGVATDPNPLEHPDAWVAYVNRYQTLIGGLLAVGAAFITIRQMRKSDERADQRHEDLMKLQLRELRESRTALATMYSNKLRIFSDVFSDFEATLLEWQIELPIPEESNWFFRQVRSCLDEVLTVLSGSDWLENKKFLDGETRVAHEELLQMVRHAQSLNMMRWSHRDRPGQEVYFPVSEESRGAAMELAAELNSICKRLTVLADGLDSED